MKKVKSIAEQYTSEMHEKFGGYYATWHPNISIELGDYGTLSNGVFHIRGNIQQLSKDKIVTGHYNNDEIKKKFVYSAKIQKSNSSLDTNYTSFGVKEHELKVAATGKISKVACSAHVGFGYKCSKEYLIIFAATELKSHFIKNIEDLQEVILNYRDAGIWKDDFVVINELIEAASVTILVSNQKNSSFEIIATGDIGLEKLNIANAQFKWKLSNSKGMQAEILAKKGIKPLFNVMGLQKEKQVLVPSSLIQEKQKLMENKNEVVSSKKFKLKKVRRKMNEICIK
jgi:hypothetical protein